MNQENQDVGEVKAKEAAATGATSGLSNRALWTSAGLLGALVMVQTLIGAGQPIGGSSASGGMVSQAGQHTMLTAESGAEDLLIVLDGRNEELFVYRTDSRRGEMQLYQRLGLAAVFNDARSRNAGR